MGWWWWCGMVKWLVQVSHGRYAIWCRKLKAKTRFEILQQRQVFQSLLFRWQQFRWSSLCYWWRYRWSDENESWWRSFLHDTESVVTRRMLSVRFAKLKTQYKNKFNVSPNGFIRNVYTVRKKRRRCVNQSFDDVVDGEAYSTQKFVPCFVFRKSLVLNFFISMLIVVKKNNTVISH